MPEVSPCATVKLRLSPAGGVQAAAGRETWYARSLAVHVAWLGLLSAPLIDRTAASPLGVGLLLAMRMGRVLGMAISAPERRDSGARRVRSQRAAGLSWGRLSPPTRSGSASA